MTTNSSSDPNKPQRFRMAIIGGGIAGLTLANAIGAHWPSPSVDIDQVLSVDIYESAPQITEIGAGVSVWPRTWKLLEALGLEKDFKEVLTEHEKRNVDGENGLAFSFRKSDQEEGFTFHQIYMAGGATFLHRQDVQKTLLAHVPSFCNIHLSHRAVECTETSTEVTVRFQNGIEASYDLVVGADGIHSVTRSCLPRLHSESLNETGLHTINHEFFTGTVAYRGLIPKEKLQEVWPGHRTIEEPVIYCGKSRHIVVYPISQGRYINVVAFVSQPENKGKPHNGPGVRDATMEEILEAYKGWEPEVIAMLKSIEKPTYWVIQEVYPLDTYISPERRVALIGDASHAMTPHLGVGAGQAMEDAFILGGVISRLPMILTNLGAQTKDIDQVIPRILEVYDKIRQPFGNLAASRARNQGLYYEFDAEELLVPPKTQTGQVAPTEKAYWEPILQHKLSDNWSWVWEGPTVVDDFRRAKEILAV